MYFLESFPPTYVPFFNLEVNGQLLAHEKMQNLKLRVKNALTAFFLTFFNVFSALSAYFDIEKTDESNIYKSSLNNLHYHRSKCLGFREEEKNL